jgi:hypothetical protein
MSEDRSCKGCVWLGKVARDYRGRHLIAWCYARSCVTTYAIGCHRKNVAQEKLQRFHIVGKGGRAFWCKIKQTSTRPPLRQVRYTPSKTGS